MGLRRRLANGYHARDLNRPPTPCHRRPGHHQAEAGHVKVRVVGVLIHELSWLRRSVGWGLRNGRRDHAPMRRPPDPRTIPYPRRALAWASIVLVLLSEVSYVSARVNEATKILRSVPSSEPKVKKPAATHRAVYTSDTTDGTIVPNSHVFPITPRMRHCRPRLASVSTHL